ncbi:hypothetical protein CBR_g44548 [Chara braunii]|uniref:Uncharacterized protein n=1 Tax=Chara braunii TaxID=69332 RepID=A0A388LXY1_CHABU|nr:hypothetical protein CBR_g44548 [Chara braunii]|eukprot:GBG87092.1 hypothetical protein CBR_g44548 [Chara braunii]
MIGFSFGVATGHRTVAGTIAQRLPQAKRNEACDDMVGPLEKPGIMSFQENEQAVVVNEKFYNGGGGMVPEGALKESKVDKEVRGGTKAFSLEFICHLMELLAQFYAEPAAGVGAISLLQPTLTVLSAQPGSSSFSFPEEEMGSSSSLAFLVSWLSSACQSAMDKFMKRKELYDILAVNSSANSIGINNAYNKVSR